MPSEPNPIILYDGVCGLCNRTVQFILKRDRKDLFRFATLQSEFAKCILQRHAIATGQLESVCLVLHAGQSDERVEVRSAAAIGIGRELSPFWRIFANLSATIPVPVRDWGYNLIARYRYRIFGKYDSCLLPSHADRQKFIDIA